MRGTYLMTRSFLPLLLKGGDKQIVNIASQGAHGKRPGASAYQNTKLTMLRFTEFIMVEYGSQGILAFAVHPGSILTEMGQRLPAALHDSELVCGRVAVPLY